LGVAEILGVLAVTSFIWIAPTLRWVRYSWIVGQ